MSVNVRHPIWLPVAPAPGIRVIAALTLIESFARAIVSTTIPIQALDLFGDEQVVSFVYTGMGLSALAFSFVIPTLIRVFARRYVYTAGAVALIVSGLAFMSFTQFGTVTGMIVRVIGVACLSVTLNLYVLDYIRREQFVLNDSVRLTLATFGWTIGPFLGVWLYTNYGPVVTYGFSMGFATVLIAVFWYLRMTDGKVIVRAQSKPPNPLRYVGRFFRQPRLRLAWLIAFGRSSFWGTFFVYGPLLMVLTGQGKEAGGVLVSAGNALLIVTILWGRLAQRTGIRPVVAFSFLTVGACMVGAGFAGESSPWLSAGFLLAGAFFVVPLDAVGGTPFYRAVRIYERPEMTSVYRTYIDFSELLPPLIYGLLLGVFGLGAVFLTLGIFLFACSVLSWVYLPRRM
ncbi:MAG: MFS transporter [Rhodospirillales bacterium]